MKSSKIICSFIFLICLTACATTQKTSRITPDFIKLGMTKESVITSLGKPYKEDYHYEADNTFIEDLYYKEYLWLHRGYWITTILVFKNNILISTKQTQDVPSNTQGEYDKINVSPIIQ